MQRIRLGFSCVSTCTQWIVELRCLALPAVDTDNLVRVMLTLVFYSSVVPNATPTRLIKDLACANNCSVVWAVSPGGESVLLIGVNSRWERLHGGETDSLGTVCTWWSSSSHFITSYASTVHLFPVNFNFTALNLSTNHCSTFSFRKLSHKRETSQRNDLKMIIYIFNQGFPRQLTVVTMATVESPCHTL